MVEDGAPGMAGSGVGELEACLANCNLASAPSTWAGQCMLGGRITLHKRITQWDE